MIPSQHRWPKWADIYFGQQCLSKRLRWSPKRGGLNHCIGEWINWLQSGHPGIHTLLVISNGEKRTYPTAMQRASVQSALHEELHMQKLGNICLQGALLHPLDLTATINKHRKLTKELPCMKISCTFCSFSQLFTSSWSWWFSLSNGFWLSNSSWKRKQIQNSNQMGWKLHYSYS